MQFSTLRLASTNNAYARTVASSRAMMWCISRIMREIKGSPARHLDTDILRMRPAALRQQFTTPCFSMAWTAYFEPVGFNRHVSRNRAGATCGDLRDV
jgi:hypothetical protein